jgi:tetratricopeptide (TPR) repeat protein
MKTSIIMLVVACGVITGAILLLNKHQSPAPAPVAVSARPSNDPAPEKVSAPKPEAPEPQPIASVQPTPVAVATPTLTETNAVALTNAITKAVDALLTAKNGEEKHALFEQLRKDGQLPAVIAELQQRAQANPNDAEISTTLGEAQLNLVRQLHESNADLDQVGILAMQADQSFNTALKIDPKNWEAQFVKASTMFYWPANEARDNDAAQRLASLIDQQDTMPTQPQFAMSYIALGNQYQKMGKQAEAIATWQLGAQKFPSDPTLQKKLSGQ